MPEPVEKSLPEAAEKVAQALEEVSDAIDSLEERGSPESGEILSIDPEKILEILGLKGKKGLLVDEIIDAIGDYPKKDASYAEADAKLMQGFLDFVDKNGTGDRDEYAKYIEDFFSIRNGAEELVNEVKIVEEEEFVAPAVPEKTSQKEKKTLEDLEMRYQSLTTQLRALDLEVINILDFDIPRASKADNEDRVFELRNRVKSLREKKKRLEAKLRNISQRIEEIKNKPTEDEMDLKKKDELEKIELRNPQIIADTIGEEAVSIDAPGVEVREIAASQEAEKTVEEGLEKGPREKAKEFFLKQDERPTFDKNNGGKEKLIGLVKHVNENIDKIRSLVEKMKERKDLSDNEKGLIKDLKRHNYIEKAWGNLSSKEQKKHGDKFNFAAFLAAKRFENIAAELEDKEVAFGDLKKKDDEFKGSWVGKKKSEGFDVAATEEKQTLEQGGKVKEWKFFKNVDGKLELVGPPTKAERVALLQRIVGIRKAQDVAMSSNREINLADLVEDNPQVLNLPKEIRMQVMEYLLESARKIRMMEIKREAQTEKKRAKKKTKKTPEEQDKVDLDNLGAELNEMFSGEVDKLEKRKAEREKEKVEKAKAEGFINTTIEEFKTFKKEVLSPSAWVKNSKEGVESAKESITEAKEEIPDILGKLKTIGDKSRVLPYIVGKPVTEEEEKNATFLSWPLRFTRKSASVVWGSFAVFGKSVKKMGRSLLKWNGADSSEVDRVTGETLDELSESENKEEIEKGETLVEKEGAELKEMHGFKLGQVFKVKPEFEGERKDSKMIRVVKFEGNTVVAEGVEIEDDVLKPTGRIVRAAIKGIIIKRMYDLMEDEDFEVELELPGDHLKEQE